MKSLKNFINEALGKDTLYLSSDKSKYQRLLTKEEVLDKYPEQSEVILKYLYKLEKPYTQYAIISNEIEDLLIKRNANRGEKWDEYQPKIMQAAKEKNKYEAEYQAILKSAEKELNDKKIAKYFFFVQY